MTAFDIVDADGKPQHVTAATDPDIFWALRGGGGDYAVVTALEVALHEAPRLYGGRVLWDGAHAAAVLDVYRGLTRTAPDELTVWFDRLHFPGGPPLVAIDATYLGGAFAGPSDSLDGPLSEPYAVYMFGAPSDPAAATAIAAKQRALATALPTSGRKPVTFLNPSESLADAPRPEALDRLRRINVERDPAGLFRSNVSSRS